MLGTRERALLLDSLRPPANFRLRRAVGTSFTLDLMALLTAPLAFTFFDAHDQDGAPFADPLALLEALRRHAEKVTLFCQAGAITIPPPEQKLLSYLEHSVVEVQPPNDRGIFHPKIWVLAFGADDRPTFYRVLCLSRNLTFDRSWDTCLRLEGSATDGLGDNARNQPIADLLLALPKLATRDISTELEEDLHQMAREVMRVEFQPPRPFTGFRVHTLGLEDRSGWPFPSSKRSLVVSPYLVHSTVHRLIRDHGLQVLISRPEALDNVACGEGRESLPGTCYVLSSRARLDARDSDEGQANEWGESPSSEDHVELSGLHAKLFLFENGRDAHLFTGSANATRAAFQGNVEVLVELLGKKKDCGIASFFGPQDDPRLETIQSLLRSYVPCGSGKGCCRKEAELARRLERLARAFGSARLTATALEVDAGHLWDLTLSGGLPRIPDSAEVSVWPATLSSEAAVGITDRSVARHTMVGPTEHLTRIATFRSLSLEALTAFFAFKVSLREGNCRVAKRFAVVAKLIGSPEDRKQRLMQSLLTDRGRVLQILFLILSGEGADVSAFVQAVRHKSTGSGGSFAGWKSTALLEALLESLSRNPRRIDDAAGLLSDLRKTPEGRNLLPEGLDEIWEPVWEAREALKA